MYDRIKNPVTNRFVKTNSKQGQQIINNYLTLFQSGGVNPHTKEKWSSYDCNYNSEDDCYDQGGVNCKWVNKTDKKKIIKVNDIKGLEENKNLKNIFLKKLSYLFSKHSIDIIKTEKSNNNYLIDIKFSITEINKEKIKLKVTWLIYDKNKKLIGDIKQENVFLKSLLTKIWPEISSKIIEMSINEINILTNLQK